MLMLYCFAISGTLERIRLSQASRLLNPVRSPSSRFMDMIGVHHRFPSNSLAVAAAVSVGTEPFMSNSPSPKESFSTPSRFPIYLTYPAGVNFLISCSSWINLVYSSEVSIFSVPLFVLISTISKSGYCSQSICSSGSTAIREPSDITRL